LLGKPRAVQRLIDIVEAAASRYWLARENKRLSPTFSLVLHVEEAKPLALA